MPRTTPIIEKGPAKGLGRKNDKEIQRINEKLKQVAEVGHFKRLRPIRIICDASKSGLNTVLQQNDGKNWRPIHLASRFLTPLESIFSIHELELLAVFLGKKALQELLLRNQVSNSL